MTEKKVHWKTAEKLAKESSKTPDLTDGLEEVSTPEIVELEKKVAKLEKEVSRPYYVYNDKANIVAYCQNEKEANEVVKGYVGGFKRMI